MREPSVIAIDFDGTCVAHEFPDIGDIGAVPVLKKLIEQGHELVLFTMRSGKHLTNATDWFLDNEIKLYGIQYNPEQVAWTSSNKCHADLYIDDAALGCPLIRPGVGRPYVDWMYVEMWLKDEGYL